MSLVLIVLQLWPESVGVPDALAGEQGLGVVAWASAGYRPALARSAYSIFVERYESEEVLP